MKHCPTCNRTYEDDTLLYCLVDGALLFRPYDPQATQPMPFSRPTNPPPTEVLPFNRKREGNNRWMIYVVIALLSVAIGGVVVALLKSNNRDYRSQDSLASAEPQHEVPSSNENRPGSVTKNTATSTLTSDNKTDSSSAVNATPSSQLVGTWQANVSELGNNMAITFTINADGTTKYFVRDAQGRTATDHGFWQYSDGILYEKFSNGASGKGAINWIDNDTIELTIIDNGVPAYSGLKRRYRLIN